MGRMASSRRTAHELASDSYNTPIRVQQSSRRPEASSTGALASWLALLGTSCGSGTLSSEDFSPGAATIIGVAIVVAVLFVVYYGGRGD
jgi:hypothetical protein